MMKGDILFILGRVSTFHPFLLRRIDPRAALADVWGFKPTALLPITLFFLLFQYIQKVPNTNVYSIEIGLAKTFAKSVSRIPLCIVTTIVTGM